MRSQMALPVTLAVMIHYVLTAMGLDEARVSEAIRISWNHDTKVDFSALTDYVKSITE